MVDKISTFFDSMGESLKSIVKIIALSRRVSITKAENPDEPIIIMGNGPSFNDTLENNLDSLLKYPTMAVNFAANTPPFRQLKPRYYTLADPHFFDNPDDQFVSQLIGNICAVDWKMTLFVPSLAKVTDNILQNKNVTVERFNANGVEGWEWLENWAYAHGAGMPRPRNVLIPSIMMSLSMGYKNIYLTGADHSWTKSLSVNENNEVVSIQTHFYKDDDKERERSKTFFLNFKLYEVFECYYVAFKNYFKIERFARRIGANVYNATPGSFIDAFKRQQLPK
jgi:hypothetical protein